MSIADVFDGVGRTWTAVELELVEALSLRVRVFTLQQATAWLDEVDTDVTLGRLQPLCDAGLLSVKDVYAHPMIAVRPPAFSWQPGMRGPTDAELQELARTFQERWNKEEVVYTAVTATSSGASLFGSYLSDPPSEDQWTHDIHVAEIFLDLRKSNPPEAMRKVVGEGALPKLGLEIRYMKDPDLFVLDEHGCAEHVIEFAGAYDFKHLKELHEHCAGGAHRKLHKHYRGRREHLFYPNPQGTPYVLV